MMSERPVVIIGAGRQGRNILDIMQTLNRPVIGFVDDVHSPGSTILGARVLGPVSELEQIIANQTASLEWAVGVGDNSAREQLTERLHRLGQTCTLAVHPQASIARSAKIGDGAYIGAFTRIQPECVLGAGVLIEAGTCVGEGVHMDDFSRTGPNASLLGGARLGRRAFVGAGAVVDEKHSLAMDCALAALSILRRPTQAGGFYVGRPAKRKTDRT